MIAGGLAIKIKDEEFDSSSFLLVAPQQFTQVRKNGFLLFL